MNPRIRIIVLGWLAFVGSLSAADRVIVTGGPALRNWENLRVPTERHDHWWANFIRASTIRMDQLRSETAGCPIVWLVYRPGYEARALEDRKPYPKWIEELATKRGVTLLWFDSGEGFIQTLNNRPRRSVQSFDYFGHSNRHSFMFDYGNSIMAASTAWLHENDLHQIRKSVFAEGAVCQSWGCHTGESMTIVWRKEFGFPLIGANGATNYTPVGLGLLPKVSGSWTQ